jgi:SMODS and SLOG-associating 2TM effector domain 1/SMODS and SLOG-associating 2TM effector domain 3
MGEWSPAHQHALGYTWGEYRVWAATSRDQKKELDGWRFWVLLLTLSGAAFGTLTQQLSGLGSWSTITGLISAMFVGLATYFSKEILNLERERRWVRARSMAEALKSQAYRFCTQTPPYDIPDAPEMLLERTQNLLQIVQDIQHVGLTEGQRQERLPKGPLSEDSYIQERVDEQINGFYRLRVREYEQLMRKIRTLSLVLGAIATVLGTVASLVAKDVIAGWVAVLTTMIASIVAYVYAGRYQYLIVSYQATAAQLELEKSRWKIRKERDPIKAKLGDFVNACEDAISIENQAWMACWLDNKPDKVDQKPE